MFNSEYLYIYDLCVYGSLISYLLLFPQAEFLWEAEMIRIKANELKSKEVAF